MADDIAQTHPYTCNTCAVAFRTGESQRNHMRTDWHRYNLKRKIADLPPVSSQDYNDKVLAAQATTKAAADQAAFVRECTVCSKIYYSENAYQNHLSSQKHKLREVAYEKGALNTPSATESVATDEPRDPEAEAEFDQVVAGMKKANLRERDPLPRRPFAPPPDADAPEEHPLSPPKPVPNAIPLSRCLFCNYDSPSLKLSIEHMMKIHGMFIPEQSYLADLEGLMAYLQAKIRQNHECLFCHRLKNNTDGIQTHMRDKGHCKIAFESEEEMIEVGQFYDFSNTYSDDEDEEDSDEEMLDSKANGGAKIDGDGDDEEWETDSDDSSVDSTDLAAGSKSHKNSRARDQNNAVFYDEHEMHLPSGRVAGHRNLKKYFRQNLRSYPSAADRMARAQRLLEDGSGEDEDMADADAQAGDAPKSQALLRRGEAGMLGVTDVQKRQVAIQEQQSRTKAQRQQNRYQAKLEKQGNSQKHFRVSLDRTAITVIPMLTISIGSSPAVSDGAEYEFGVIFALERS